VVEVQQRVREAEVRKHSHVSHGRRSHTKTSELREYIKYKNKLKKESLPGNIVALCEPLALKAGKGRDGSIRGIVKVTAVAAPVVAHELGALTHYRMENAQPRYYTNYYNNL
jgi:hypothetical protein